MQSRPRATRMIDTVMASLIAATIVTATGWTLGVFETGINIEHKISTLAQSSKKQDQEMTSLAGAVKSNSKSISSLAVQISRSESASNFYDRRIELMQAQLNRIEDKLDRRLDSEVQQ